MQENLTTVPVKLVTGRHLQCWDRPHIIGHFENENLDLLFFATLVLLSLVAP